MKRVLVALFMAAVACGICFYLITFCGLMVVLFTKGVNPANTPGLNEALRKVAIPVSGVLAASVFVLAVRKKASPSAERRQRSKVEAA